MIKTKYFYLSVLMLSPLYLVKISIFHLPTNLHEILMILFILLAAFRVKKDALSAFFHKNKLLWMGIFFLLAGLLASMVYNETYALSMGIITGWFIIPLCFSLACLHFIENTNDIRNIFISLFVSISFVSIISLVLLACGEKTYDGRLQGFYNSPNYLAMFLAPGVFIWFFMRQTGKLSATERITFNIGIVPILLSLHLTYSYASWIGIFLALLFSARIIKKVYLQKTALSAAIILFLSFIFFQLNTQKFSSLATMSDRSSLSSRLMIWKSAGKIIQDNALFGIGSGNFQQKYLEYQRFFMPYLEWAVPHPHNLLLSFWLQSGILGLFGFMVVLIWIFKKIFHMKKKNPREVALFSILLCYYLYTLIHGLIDTTYWKNDLSLIFWLFTFVLIKLDSKDLLERYPI